MAFAQDDNGDRSGRDGDDNRGGRDERSERTGDDRSGRDDREDRADDDSDRDGTDDRESRRGREGNRDGRAEDDGDRSGRERVDPDDGRRSGRERDDDGIEVTLDDGSRIEIENGRFRQKDPDGRTIEERPATAQDFRSVLSQRSDPEGTLRGGGTVAKAEVSGTDIEIVHSDGWKDEIDAGRYELKDALNRTVIERLATAKDRARLSAAAR